MSNNIKKLLDIKGVKQIEFAKRIGISQQYANKIANGSIGLGPSILIKIASSYPDINLRWLLGLPNEDILVKSKGQQASKVESDSETHGTNKGKVIFNPTINTQSDRRRLALYMLKNIDEMEKEPVFISYINEKAYKIALDIIAEKFFNKP